MNAQVQDLASNLWSIFHNFDKISHIAEMHVRRSSHVWIQGPHRFNAAFLHSVKQ